MSVPGLRAMPAVRRWTGLLLLSAAFHAAVLSVFAARLPMGPAVAAETASDVRLLPAPPIVRLPAAPAAAPGPAPQTRLVVLETAPRFAGPPQAATGEASDSVDLFGPVFADGTWPRPIALASAACDPEDPPERGDACRRELMLLGIAPAPGAAKVDR